MVTGTNGFMSGERSMDALFPVLCTPAAELVALLVPPLQASSNALKDSNGKPMFGGATSFVAGLIAGALGAWRASSPEQHRAAYMYVRWC